jgi:hypothetical protein
MKRTVNFWDFANSGSDFWYLEEDAAYEDWANTTRFRAGFPMAKGEWPSPPPLFCYDSVKQFVDLPGCLRLTIVSGRLRTLLEQLAPGSAEFLPVRLKGPRSDELPDTYWGVNWLRVIDCLHAESFNIDEQGKRYVEVPVIDPSKIPADFVLGVLEHFRVQVLVRNDLRLALKKAGVRGTQFYKVASIDRPESITWHKVDWTESDEGAERRELPPRPPPKRVPPRRKRGT